MEQSEAQDILRKLRAELTEANATVAAAQRRVAALDKLVEGYVELFPGLASPESTGQTHAETDERPKGQDAVLKVMESIEFKGRYWTVSAMVEELTRRDWLPESKGDPGNAVRTALDRLATSGGLVHKGRGEHGVVFYYEGEGYPSPRFAGERSDPNPWPRPVIAPRRLDSVGEEAQVAGE